MAIVVAGLVIVVVAAVTYGVKLADRCGECACYRLAKPFPGGRVARVARRDERYTLPFGFSLPPSLRFRFVTPPSSDGGLNYIRLKTTSSVSPPM